MPAHTERDFETAIEAGLIGAGGYAKRAPAAYDEALALFPDDVTGFLKDSQAAKWRQLEALPGARTQATMLDSLAKELDTQGNAAHPAARLQMLRQDLPAGLFPPQLRHEPRRRRGLCPEPADHHPSIGVHL